MLSAYREGLKNIWGVLQRPSYALLAIILYLPILWIFVYVAEFELFMHIIGLESLSTGEKISFMATSVLNIFTYMGDPLALSAIIFSLFATVNIVMIIYSLRQRRRAKIHGQGAAGLAIVGSHCIACGGSLLAPIITALSGSSAYISAARVTTTTLIILSINIIAIILISHATMKIAANTPSKGGF